MGKRSDFARRPMDAYATPYEAVLPLIPHLRGVETFAEPCVGEWKLVAHLKRHGLRLRYANDIQDGDGADSLDLSFVGADAIITNPPWTRQILHPMILHFQKQAPTWLLFDADWSHTKQAIPFMDQCSHIVSVGRVKWIAESKFTGKDNACWYRSLNANLATKATARS
jgi:hypothetical protein